MLFPQRICDGKQQVGLAQTGAAVNEQRVIKSGRIVGNSQCRRVGEFVGVAHDELFKGVAGINAGIALQPPAVGLRTKHIQRLDRTAHQAGDDIGNIIGKTVGQGIPEQLAGGLHHKQIVLDGNGFGIGEPGIHQDLTHFRTQLPEHRIQQRFRRIHIQNPLFQKQNYEQKQLIYYTTMPFLKSIIIWLYILIYSLNKKRKIHLFFRKFFGVL